MSALAARLNTILLVLLVVIGLSIIAMLAARSDAGPLDPPGPPGPSGTIQESSSWAQQLSGIGGCDSPRFKCVYPTAAQPTGEGVLDRETGLVWQRTVSSSAFTWIDAVVTCYGATSGGEWGWRLPTITELQTVADPSPGAGGIPPGMPFLPGGVGSREYWSASPLIYPGVDDISYYFDFDGEVSNTFQSNMKGRWCVRGPGK